jgi:hypothetical protein
MIAEREREREREREKESILAYFRQHNIKSIKLESDNLVIEYQSETTETKSTKGTGKTKSQMKCDKCGFKKD